MIAPEFIAVGDLPEHVEWRAALVCATDQSGRFLFQLRDDLPHVVGGGKWCLFGGGVEQGESLIEAARREFHEETGILLAPEDLEPLAVVASSSAQRGVLYAYRSLRPIVPDQIRLGEGAGFALLTMTQAQGYDLVASTRQILTVL